MSEKRFIAVKLNLETENGYGVWDNQNGVQIIGGVDKAKANYIADTMNSEPETIAKELNK